MVSRLIGIKTKIHVALFPTAAVTNYIGGLKTHTFILLQFWGSEIRSTGLKSRSAGLYSLQKLWGESLSLVTVASGSCLHTWALAPPPFAKPAAHPMPYLPRPGPVSSCIPLLRAPVMANLPIPRLLI